MTCDATVADRRMVIARAGGSACECGAGPGHLLPIWTFLKSGGTKLPIHGHTSSS